MAQAKLVYLDSSAFVKLVTPEPETQPLVGVRLLPMSSRVRRRAGELEPCA